MAYEIKYFILKKGQRLRGYSVKPSPVCSVGVETIVATYCNFREDVKVEFRDLEFGNEQGLSISINDNMILIYCTRFEVKEE